MNANPAVGGSSGGRLSPTHRWRSARTVAVRCIACSAAAPDLFFGTTATAGGDPAGATVASIGRAQPAADARSGATGRRAGADDDHHRVPGCLRARFLAAPGSLAGRGPGALQDLHLRL